VVSECLFVNAGAVQSSDKVEALGEEELMKLLTDTYADESTDAAELTDAQLEVIMDRKSLFREKPASAKKKAATSKVKGNKGFMICEEAEKPDGLSIF